ncbi:ribosome assembly factor SBDS [Candidatus Hecatella orcuttiae]|jgi:ribosome maturation protein SDO1|uniref:ribosome assembly factor SBDS n=1 Tax=Candidatus Hecatella orcuttiae TaxID=1935119 RepID=UPI0028680196|nr:ribosome assembly factor SBDS [Candidatus Hecatella orcuttiae]
MSQKYTVARLVLGGDRFEIMVHPDKAMDYKLGKPVSLSQILISETIFKDVSKGERASEEKLKKAFGTLDSQAVSKVILDKGELQFTAQQRRQLIEDKKRQIVAFICKYCADPRTGLPHPPLRVEQAMGQVRVSIDPFRSTEEQAKELIQALRPVLPLKMEMVSVEVKLPPRYAPAAYGTLKSFGTIKQEQWTSDGSLVAVVEMPVGLHGPFLEKLGNLTKGSVESRLLK